MSTFKNGTPATIGTRCHKKSIEPGKIIKGIVMESEKGPRVIVDSPAGRSSHLTEEFNPLTAPAPDAPAPAPAAAGD